MSAWRSASRLLPLHLRRSTGHVHVLSGPATYCIGAQQTAGRLLRRGVGCGKQPCHLSTELCAQLGGVCQDRIRAIGAQCVGSIDASYLRPLRRVARDGILVWPLHFTAAANAGPHAALPARIPKDCFHPRNLRSLRIHIRLTIRRQCHPRPAGGERGSGTARAV